MPTLLTRALFAVAVSALCVGCGEDDDNTDPDGAKKLYEQIVADKYTEWDRAPGYEMREKSGAPHGGEVDIYVNDTVAAALAGDKISSWPVGSIIAKDGFDGGKLSLVAIMEKRKGGWYWAELDGSGGVLFSGEPSVCTDCHGSGADSVRAFGFPQ